MSNAPSALSKTGTGGYCEDPELKRNVSANIAVDRRQGADSADSSTELSNKDYRGTATHGAAGRGESYVRVVMFCGKAGKTKNISSVCRKYLLLRLGWWAGDGRDVIGPGLVTRLMVAASGDQAPVPGHCPAQPCHIHRPEPATSIHHRITPQYSPTRTLDTSYFQILQMNKMRRPFGLTL